MKITIKTLQQKAFTVVIDEEETVLTLKQQIEAEQGSGFPASGLKLIYSGKILIDANKLSEYKIQENNFVVVMVTKGKTPSTQTSSTASTPSTSGATSTLPATNTTTITETTTDTQSTPMETTPQQDTTPTASREQQSTTLSTTPPIEQTDTPVTTSQGTLQDNAASTLAVGEDYNKAIVSLIEMGFSDADSRHAMEVSFNNPHRAAEYLFQRGTMPPEEQLIQEPPSQEISEGGQQPPEGVVGGEGEGEESNTADLFQLLGQVPQFEQLRVHIRDNPAMLPMLLQQIRHSNPELFTLISQNPDQFLRLINNANTQSSGTEPASGMGPGMGPGIAPGPSPGTVSIAVTPQEKEAIERLKGMGFPEHAVIQAYFACEKNEELAANFLLQNKDEDY